MPLPTLGLLLLLAVPLSLAGAASGNALPGGPTSLPSPAGMHTPSFVVPARLAADRTGPVGGPVAPGTGLALPPAGPPAWGWPTPRGPLTENASSPGYAPEVNLTTGVPSVLATAVLGPAAGNATGLAIVPGGPLVLTLANGTIFGLDPQSLATRWWQNVSPDDLLSGPTIAGEEVFAVGSSGRLYAWNLTTGGPLWSRGLGSPGLGAAPLPVRGDLFALSRTNLSIVNATTGALLYRGPNGSADPTATPALGGSELFAQGGGSLENFSLLGQLRGALPDLVGPGGSVLVSDGSVAVAGSDGEITGNLSPLGQWRHALTSGVPLLPAAASNGAIFVANASGPLFAFSESYGVRLWRAPFVATSAPVVAASEVLVGGILNGTGNALVALNASTGTQLWNVSMPAPVRTAPAVGGGLLYAISTAGNLTALGAAPVVITSASASRAEAAVGSPVTFHAKAGGGAGGALSVTWYFSDGGTATGPTVNYTFSMVGTAWAWAVATDGQGYQSAPAELSVQVLPRLVGTLVADTTSGSAPLWVNLTLTVAGGSGSYTVVFQVQGENAGWYVPPLLSLDLEFRSNGGATVLAWVNDTAQDGVRSNPVTIVIGPADFVPPVVSLVATGPGEVTALWTAPPVPGFLGWQVNVSQDGGPWVPTAHLTSPSASSVILQGLLLHDNVAVNVTLETSFGPFTGAASLLTPLVAPRLGISEAPGLPGQAQLSWSLPASVDGLAGWVVLETLPGASQPVALPLPPGPYAYAGSNVTAPVPNLRTTVFAVEVTTSDGTTNTSAPVPFTPIWTPPPFQVTASDLTLKVSWTPFTIPLFAYVWVCEVPSATGATLCPVNSTALEAAGTTFTVEGAGAYTVFLLVHLENGFTVRSGNATVNATAPPAPPAWYAATVLGMPLWTLALVGLLALVALALAARLRRERQTIPSYLGEVMPWDPLAPDLEPRARPKDPATLRVTPKLHRHRDSHTHRHERVHGALRRGEAPDEVVGGPEDAPEGGQEGSRAVPIRVKKGTGSVPRPRRPGTEEGSGDEEEEGPEGAEPSSHRPPGRSTPREPRGRNGRDDDEGGPEDVEIDQVGEEGPPRRADGPGRARERASAAAPENGEIARLPVVLRHRDAPTRTPTDDEAIAPRSEEGGRGGHEGGAPRRPGPPRPKPSEDEPTL